MQGHGPPEIRVDEWWHISGGVVWHQEEKPEPFEDKDDPEELTYADDLVSDKAQVWRKKYVWVYINNGCGDQYSCVYDIKKCLKLTDEQKALVEAATE